MYQGKDQLNFLAANSPIDFLLPVFPGAPAVQAGKQTLSLPIPVSWCYQFLSILFQGTGAAVTAAMIQEYRLKANGYLIHQMSGSFRDQINVYYGYPTGVNPDGQHANDFLLMIPFNRQKSEGAAFMYTASAAGIPTSFGAFTKEDVDMETCLNCGSQDPVTGIAITQLLLEVDLVNTNASGMTSIGVVNRAKVYPQDLSVGPGLILFWNHMTFNSAVGTNSIIQGNGLLYGDLNHTYWEAEFLFPPATQTMDSWQIWLNGQEIFQRTSEENFYWIKIYGQRTPQSPVAGNMFVLDFCETGYGDGMKFIQPQATSAKIQYTAGVAGGNVDLIQKSLGFLG